MPQRAQNTSTPRSNGALQLAQVEVDAVVTTRVPQCPQKGIPSSTVRAQRGQLTGADTDIGFPQSMQKRDASSFSRPQKAQAVTGGR